MFRKPYKSFSRLVTIPIQTVFILVTIRVHHRPVLCSPTFAGTNLPIPVAARLDSEACSGMRARYACDPDNPAMFHICLGRKRFTLICPGELHFNERTQTCDWPEYATCGRLSRVQLTNPSSTTSYSPKLVDLDYAEGFRAFNDSEDPYNIGQSHSKINSVNYKEENQLYEFFREGKLTLKKGHVKPAFVPYRGQNEPTNKISYTSKSSAAPFNLREKSDFNLKRRTRNLIQGQAKRRSRIFRQRVSGEKKVSSLSKWWNNPVLTSPAPATTVFPGNKDSSRGNYASNLIQPYSANIKTKVSFPFQQNTAERAKVLKLTSSDKNPKRRKVKASYESYRSALKVPWYRPSQHVNSNGAITSSYSFKTRTSREARPTPRKPMISSPFKPFTRPPVYLTRLKHKKASRGPDDGFVTSPLVPMGPGYRYMSDDVSNTHGPGMSKSLDKDKQKFEENKNFKEGISYVNLKQEFHKPHATLKAMLNKPPKQPSLSIAIEPIPDIDKSRQHAQKPLSRWAFDVPTTKPRLFVDYRSLGSAYEQHEPSRYASALSDSRRSLALGNVKHYDNSYNGSVVAVKMAEALQEHIIPAAHAVTDKHNKGVYHAKLAMLDNDWRTLHGVSSIPDYNPAQANRYYSSIYPTSPKDISYRNTEEIKHKPRSNGANSLRSFLDGDERGNYPVIEAHSDTIDSKKPDQLIQSHNHNSHITGINSAAKIEDNDNHFLKKKFSNMRRRNIALAKDKYDFVVGSEFSDDPKSSKAFVNHLMTEINNAAAKIEKKGTENKPTYLDKSRQRSFRSKTSMKTLPKKSEARSPIYRRRPVSRRDQHSKSPFSQPDRASQASSVFEEPYVNRLQDGIARTLTGAQDKMTVPTPLHTRYRSEKNEEQNKSKFKNSLKSNPQSERRASVFGSYRVAKEPPMRKTLPKLKTDSQANRHKRGPLATPLPNNINDDHSNFEEMYKLTSFPTNSQQPASKTPDQGRGISGDKETIAAAWKPKTGDRTQGSVTRYKDDHSSHKPTQIAGLFPEPARYRFTDARRYSFNPLALAQNQRRTQPIKEVSTHTPAYTRNRDALDISNHYFNRSPSRANHFNRLPTQDFALITHALRSSSNKNKAITKLAVNSNNVRKDPSTLNFDLHGLRAPRPAQRIFALRRPSLGKSHNQQRRAKNNDFSRHSLQGFKFNEHAVPASKTQPHTPVALKDSLFELRENQHNQGAKERVTRTPPVEKYKKRAGGCSSKWCKLPNCRCIGTDIPGELKPQEVPQMVLLTFDDSINIQNINYYRRLFNGTLRNPNGCPIKSTFFVSGDSTDYKLVKEVYRHGHEIASHTLSHRSPTTWWGYAGYDNWNNEVVGMRERLHKKAGIPMENITGMRAPFLQVGGDDQYAMLAENNFRYDSSMVTGPLRSNTRPPVWPFTLDSAPDSQTCSLTPCPKRSYPGLWEVPLVRWYGSNKMACAMPDACIIGAGAKGARRFLEENFKRHYRTNKAPLGIFIHASWFGRQRGNLEGLAQFLDNLSQLEDVWVVSVSQALDWIQHPVPVSKLESVKSWGC
ncbi:chitin deacetylase 5a [Plakobranchus ocellatus]|uniref:Chitin deacetylase 5a n=1 Tax=Plakobranchus ocellatus TaxID=259542 RepID=A0AAV3ZDY6_9GAST|nr:chitin deacetylase 5a [Plakobranchus ocellatus]